MYLDCDDVYGNGNVYSQNECIMKGTRHGLPAQLDAGLDTPSRQHRRPTVFPEGSAQFLIFKDFLPSLVIAAAHGEGGACRDDHNVRVRCSPQRTVRFT